ncbi:hypothetical protein ACLESO_38540 [Pyxidicoccus sp. 3LG]
MRPRQGVLGARTAAMTFAVLELLSLRQPLRGMLGREGSRGLALAALGGATLRLLKSRLDRGPWWRKPARRLRRARARTGQEPAEAALVVAVLGVLALPLVLAPTSVRRLGAHPEEMAPRRPEPARSESDDGDDGDGLDFNGAIASW